jgi:hypothetical protein
VVVGAGFVLAVAVVALLIGTEPTRPSPAGTSARNAPSNYVPATPSYSYAPDMPSYPTSSFGSYGSYGSYDSYGGSPSYPSTVEDDYWDRWLDRSTFCNPYMEDNSCDD